MLTQSEYQKNVNKAQAFEKAVSQCRGIKVLYNPIGSMLTLITVCEWTLFLSKSTQKRSRKKLLCFFASLYLLIDLTQQSKT